ncbi:MAG: tyrosine-type recombinase/integrase [Gammaproteobacteria bacterium]
MPLTDRAIRGAKPRERPVKLRDGGGLYPPLVNPNGSRWWRLRFRYGGKENLLSLGVYPAVGLKDARARRDAARKQLASGIDPSAARKAAKTAEADSFEAVAREWYAKRAPGWAPSHSDKIIRRLERDIFPWLGSRPVAAVTAPELLAVLRRIETRGAIDTAHRAHQNCGQVFRYAIATGRADRDPSADLRGALPPVRAEHFAALTEPKAVGALLRALDAFSGTYPVLCALRLSPLVFVRPGELRKALWADIDLEAAVWRFTVTKTRTEHLVPLAVQAVAILRELRPLTGAGRYVFPGRDPKKPMSGAAVNAALRRMGYDTKTEITGHGFRAMARTVLDEVLGFPAHLIEHQLAHAVRDPLGRAYNRTAHLPERRRMMQAWADYLNGLKAGAEVIPLRRA